MLEVGTNVLKSTLRLYNRTEDGFAEDIDRLKEWMRQQKHLPEILDDKHIQNFLLLNKCDVEKTKQRIETYYTVRSKFPEMFAHINPRLSKMSKFFEIMYFTPLPKLTRDNYRVLLLKIRKKELIDELNPHEMLGHNLATMEMRFVEDLMAGEIVVFDVEGVNFKFLMKFTPIALYKLIYIYQKVFSLPMKGLYLLNCTPMFNPFVKLLKTFIKPKLLPRICLCPDTSVLTKNVEKEILPKDYGGEERSLEELQDLLKVKFIQYQDRFDLLDTLRVDERLRPRKNKSDKTVTTDFRKLDLD